jgi:hypothetical protein
MAEPLSTTDVSLAPEPTARPIERFMGVEVPPPTPQDGYTITIRRFAAAGDVKPMVVHIPQGATVDSIVNTPLILAALLKDGDPVWQQMEPGFVLYACCRAQRLGLDIMDGDIYPIEGRTATSDKAKIKFALRSGKLSDAPQIETTEGQQIDIPWETKREKGVWTGKDLTTTVTLRVRGWDSPLVYRTTLRKWFKGSNPNWRNNPEGMLELRAYAKACERVCPVGLEPEEAPPLEVLSGPPIGGSITEQLQKSLAAQKQK